MEFIDLIDEEAKIKLERRRYKKGDTILFAEKENKYFYFLTEGSAEAYVQTPQGSYANLYIYKAGSFFGEIEQFYEGSKPVEITAFTSCTVERLYKDDFLEWLERDFEATKFLIRELSHKLIINAKLVEEVLMLTVKERMLRSIAIHHHRNTLDKLSKKQLSKEVNTPIRSINRAISECTRDGIICFEDERIEVLNREKLLEHFPEY